MWIAGRNQRSGSIRATLERAKTRGGQQQDERGGQQQGKDRLSKHPCPTLPAHVQPHAADISILWQIRRAWLEEVKDGAAVSDRFPSARVEATGGAMARLRQASILMVLVLAMLADAGQIWAVL